MNSGIGDPLLYILIQTSEDHICHFLLYLLLHTLKHDKNVVEDGVWCKKWHR